jgi:hypothetical protein
MALCVRDGDPLKVATQTSQYSEGPVHILQASLCQYDPLLREFAMRLLDSAEGVEIVLGNCRRYALLCAPPFESEGAFRTWLFRLLFDEARAHLLARSLLVP